jgi:UPF0176 protein
MFTVAALYRFTAFEDPEALKAPLARIACANHVRGTLLLAGEGINGTIAGTREGIDAVLAHIRRLPACADLDVKESVAQEMPFGRMKVRVKPEIVTMGVPGADPRRSVGRYVEPADWNELITAPDVVVIDTRNQYEIGIGTFRGSIDPQTTTFREFPAWWAENRVRFEGKRVAMFCTGGIRCEKATNYVMSEGAGEVFHLKGGILKYLEDVPEEDSLWQGQCFVFDERVSVGQGLKQGDLGLCRACRRPLSSVDRERPGYEPGVSCHRCMGEYSDADRERFRERQRQVELAAARGARHLG